MIVKDDSGGPSSKLHLVMDGRGLPMRTILTAGQAGDNPQLVPLLDAINVRRAGPGRPRTRPDEVRADKTHFHPSTRQALRAKRIRFTCPERSDQLTHRAELTIAAIVLWLRHDPQDRP